MNIVARLKRLLEDRKYRIVDLKPGHAYFLWVKNDSKDMASALVPILRDLKNMNIEMFVTISEEALLIECKD